MTSETRILFIHSGEGFDEWDEITQTAIPRCTAHNMGGLIDDRCVAGQMRIDDPTSDEPAGCVISRGGPDHKWWRDAWPTVSSVVGPPPKSVAKSATRFTTPSTGRKSPHEPVVAYACSQRRP